MNPGRTRLFWTVALVLTMSSIGLMHNAAADRYDGTFHNARMTVELNGFNGDYIGTIRLGEQAFPLRARDFGKRLEGRFQTAGREFAFSASIAGDNLVLSSGGARHTLARNGGGTSRGFAPVQQIAAHQAAPRPPLAAELEGLRRRRTATASSLRGTFGRATSWPATF